MNTPLMQLLAQRTPFGGDPRGSAAPREAVRDYFMRGGDSRELLYLILTMLALVALLVVVHRALGRASERPPANNPQKLFRSVLAKLNLGVKERDLLRRLARDRRLEHPITLVLCSDVFRTYGERWLTEQASEGQPGSADRARQMDILYRALFDEPLSRATKPTKNEI